MVLQAIARRPRALQSIVSVYIKGGRYWHVLRGHLWGMRERRVYCMQSRQDKCKWISKKAFEIGCRKLKMDCKERDVQKHLLIYFIEKAITDVPFL
jgi:hypothetical protein